jgi:hypothetical protein
VFELVPEAIILEDDCLPDPTFFRFCQEMLEKYRDDERIGMISGDNFQLGRRRGDASYYFSRYSHIWGWASWRRAWRHYDVNANVWPEMRDHNWLDEITESSSERKFWTKIFQAVFDQKIDTWDYQWVLASWSQGMLSVIPNVNLISNIGFGTDATHTHGVSAYANVPCGSMSFPIQNPKIILRHSVADAFSSRRMFSNSISMSLEKISALIFKKLGI